MWDFLARPCMRQGVDYVTDGCAHDLQSTTGFLYAIRQVLRVKEGGLSFWGLPCNSFSFMARSLHQRTADSPFGCQHHGFVIAGNILATRMVCLIALGIVRRLRFFVEQPDRSMAIVFPYLMHIMSFTQIEPQRVFWWMPYLIYMQSIGWNPSYLIWYIRFRSFLGGLFDFCTYFMGISTNRIYVWIAWSEHGNQWDNALSSLPPMVLALGGWAHLEDGARNRSLGLAIGNLSLHNRADQNQLCNLFCIPYSFPMIGTVQLSSWMGKLFRPMGPGYRLQIKARAAAQKREMTKKSVHKVTQKPQVYFGGS